MKKSFAVVLFLAFLIMPLTLWAQSGGIVYVDLQKVMLDSEKGKEAKRALTDEANKVKKSLEAKQDELQRMKDALEKQAATITPEARAEKEKQYQAKLKDYQRQANDAQAELQQKDMEMTQKILKEIEEAVKTVANRDKYLLILEKSQGGILFANPSIDVTARVIAAYNDATKRK